MVLAVLVLTVTGCVVAVHWPVLSAHAFMLDDQQFLADNPLVRDPSWASVGQFFREVRAPSTVGGYYLPLSMTSLMLDYALGGRPYDLRPFHRTSLALHALNSVLVVLLVYSLFRRPWVAAVAGLLFGLHPLAVEPIAWIGERKTPLATLFALLALLAYVRWAARPPSNEVHGGRRRPGWWLYATAWACFLLSLLSKPTTTPLPVVLLLLLFWPLRRLSVRSTLQTLPFFALAGGSAVITLISHSKTAGLIAPASEYAGESLVRAAYLLAFYFAKIIWPVGLTPCYVLPAPLRPSHPLVLLGLAATALVVVVALWALRRARAPATGLGIFLVAILPRWVLSNTVGWWRRTNMCTGRWSGSSWRWPGGWQRRRNGW